MDGSSTAQPQRKRVVVLEPDGNLRALLAGWLAEAQLEVVAPAGRLEVEATLVSGEPPRAILADLDFPVMEGVDMVALLPTLAKDTPVVGLCGLPAGRKPDWVKVAGLVPKPFYLDELAQVVRQALERGPSTGAAAPRPVVGLDAHRARQHHDGGGSLAGTR
jgi:DNA-binding response OmpR family regulator